MQNEGTLRKEDKRSVAKESIRELITRGRIAGEVDVIWAWVVTRERSA
jgi:hypothetical protein